MTQPGRAFKRAAALLQPAGLPESSRRSKRSGDLRCGWSRPHPGGVPDLLSIIHKKSCTPFRVPTRVDRFPVVCDHRLLSCSPLGLPPSRHRVTDSRPDESRMSLPLKGRAKLKPTLGVEDLIRGSDIQSGVAASLYRRTQNHSSSKTLIRSSGSAGGTLTSSKFSSTCARWLMPTSAVVMPGAERTN